MTAYESRPAVSAQVTSHPAVVTDCTSKEEV